jgi:hypothetical protein
MAGQEPCLGFTGSLYNISAYKRRDMDTIIIRSNGGPSKRMIKSHPSFELTRKNNKEFGGRSTASKWIMRILYPLKPLSDYNISGPLNCWKAFSSIFPKTPASRWRDPRFSLVFLFLKTIRKIKIIGCSRSIGTSYPKFIRKRLSHGVLRDLQSNFGSASKKLVKIFLHLFIAIKWKHINRPGTLNLIKFV